MKKGEEDGKNEMKEMREESARGKDLFVELLCTSSVKRSFLLCLRTEISYLNQFIAHLKCQSLKRSSFRHIYMHAVQPFR